MKTGPEAFLHRQQRRSNGVFLAWGVASVLLAMAWEGAMRLQWISAGRGWEGVPILAAGALLIRWVDRIWRLAQVGVARECDARWNLQGRMESLVELAGSRSPVAMSLRAETARRLESLKPVGTTPWACGLGAMIAVALVLGAEGVTWSRRHQRPATTAFPVAPSGHRPTAELRPAVQTPTAMPKPIKLNATPARPHLFDATLLAKPFKLRSRAATPAGRLEELAKRQRSIAQSLQEPSTVPMMGQRPVAERQASVARDTAVLAGERTLVQIAQSRLESAAEAGAEAARQLGLGDTAAAKEPATEAWLALQQAVDAQENEGRDKANAVLQQVRDQIAQASPATQATAVATARQELRAEALRQQNEGSAAAAQQLAALADKLGSDQSPGEKSSTGAEASETGQSHGGAGQKSSGEDDSGSASSPSTGAEQAGSGSAGSSSTGNGSESGGGASDSTGAGSQPGNSQSGGGSGGSESNGGGPGMGGSGTQPGGSTQTASTTGGPGNGSANSPGPGKDSRTKSDQPGGTDSQGSGSQRQGAGATENSPAAQVAETQATLSPEAALSQAIGKLGGGPPGVGRSGNLVHLSEALTDLKYAVQQITFLPHNAELIGITTAIEAKMKGHADGEAISEAELQDLLGQARRLANALEAEKTSRERDEWISGFRPTDIDPDYQRAVQDYFQALSRESSNR